MLCKIPPEYLYRFGNVIGRRCLIRRALVRRALVRWALVRRALVRQALVRRALVRLPESKLVQLISFICNILICRGSLIHRWHCRTLWNVTSLRLFYSILSFHVLVIGLVDGHDVILNVPVYIVAIVSSQLHQVVAIGSIQRIVAPNSPNAICKLGQGGREALGCGVFTRIYNRIYRGSWTSPAE